MTYAVIDVIFLIVILLFAISAASKGLIGEVFGKASFVLSIIAAVIFTPLLQSYVTNTIKHLMAAKVLSFLIIFTMSFLVIRIIQAIMKKIFSGQILKSLDRSLGLCLGIAEGVVVVAFVILILKKQPWFDTRGLLQGSIFVRIFDDAVLVLPNSEGMWQTGGENV